VPESSPLNRERNSRDVLRARDAPPGTRPKRADLEPTVVAKRVLKDCAEHPATIFPLAGSALAVAWTFIIAASPASLLAAVGLAVVGAVSFVYNFVLKGKPRVERRQRELMDLRRQHDLYEVYRVGLECQDAGFDEGAKEAGELIIAYEKLAKFITSQEGASVASFNQQAEDVYKQGAQTIRKAFELYKALNSIDVKTLKRELKSWETRREKLEGTETEAKTLDKQIAGHKRRLEQFDERTEELAELFAAVNDIEEALETAYLDVVQMGNADPADYLSEDGGAANRLRNAVAARRRVEEKLRGVGEEAEAEKEKRNKYIRLAQRAASQEDGETEQEVE